MSKKCNTQSCQKRTSIGGQALIEGIMMRGPKVTAMAVRNPEGEIVLEKWDTVPSPKKAKTQVHHVGDEVSAETVSTRKTKSFSAAKIPVIRGVVNFISSMKIGYKCLMRSAEIAMPEELTEPKKKNAPETEATPAVEEIPTPASDSPAADTPATVTEEKNPESSKKGKEKQKTSLLMGAIMVVATVLGVVLAVGLFIMLPTFIYKWCAGVMPFLAPENPALRSLVKSVFEGVLKIAVLVAYMLAVRLMNDIKRTFQYHGAEHKTIFCYEHGKELTVENVRNEMRFHPRCGTSFLILMLIVGIFISFFIDPVSLLIFDRVPPTFLRAIIRLLLLPLMMGVGYELIKLAGRHDNLFTRIISAPGLWLQRITVLEPDDDMIECALAAFKEVLPEEEKKALTEKTDS